MRIKLDENLPTGLGEHLRIMGHDVDTVPDEGLQGKDDATVWEATRKEGRFLITQDLDFSDTRRYSPGSHHGLMIVRLRTPGRIALTTRIRSIIATEEIESWTGCFIVVTDNKILTYPR